MTLNLLQDLYLILGLFILIVAVPVAQLIKNPPAGYVPPGLLVVELILAVMTKPLKETKETDSYGEVDTLVS